MFAFQKSVLFFNQMRNFGAFPEFDDGHSGNPERGQAES
jgi:hypothetical protein